MLTSIDADNITAAVPGECAKLDVEPPPETSLRKLSAEESRDDAALTGFQPGIADITDNHSEIEDLEPWLKYPKKTVTPNYDKAVRRNAVTVLTIDGAEFSLVAGENTYQTSISNIQITTCCSPAVSNDDNYKHYAAIIATKSDQKFLSLSEKGKQGFKYYSKKKFISVKSCSLDDRLLCVPIYNNGTSITLFVPVGIVSHDDYTDKAIKNGIPDRLLTSTITLSTPVPESVKETDGKPGDKKRKLCMKLP